MIVAGGAYLEICLRPEWRRLFGSGLRAAAAVSRLSPGTVLHTYGTGDRMKSIEYSAHAFDCTAIVHPTETAITFHYLHPLSPAVRLPAAIPQHASLEVSGPVVLRFGMLEGDAIVNAETAVYDPQSSDASVPFGANGSRAGRLALVMNEDEAGILSDRGFDPDGILTLHKADVLVVKRGPRGATVHIPNGVMEAVPAYKSGSVFKIGSGDVFSAAFAHYWGARRLDPAQAADLASRSVAEFVDGHLLPLRDIGHAEAREPAPAISDQVIYLAGPFFDLGQRWLIEETLSTLRSLGIRVFSPLHEVGTGRPAAHIADADLKGLRGCSAVLALLDGLDPGTVFEVGYARALGIPVVALAERVQTEHLTMMTGSGCDVVDDFTTAVYRTFWAARK